MSNAEGDTGKIRILVRDELNTAGFNKELCDEKHKSMEQRLAAMEQNIKTHVEETSRTVTRIFDKLDKQGERGFTTIFTLLNTAGVFILGIVMFLLRGS